ncbi:GtrA family protein [Piscinibacter sp.]|uniref:GtrA family protein n=1 Tax=Piscinibacter sp. TaxID=1903157 RepID=UPI002BD63BCA|nr:GtrA family protein [Albitalea sp.]HUG25831.1 GtrA family protein [Albitalea sp.]
MSLTRQGRHYLTIGIVQWLLDWGVMVMLSHLGMPVRQANVVGRISGALLGFWLNGRITFAAEGHSLGRTQFARFLAMWLVMTLVSTVAIGTIDDYLGLKWAWLAKPAVEVVLGLVGFLISRHWIYRR